MSGLGVKTLQKLLQRVESGKDLWQAPESFLKEHLSERIFDAFLSTRKQLNPIQEWERYQTLGIQMISYRETEYPELLNQIHDPPTLLFIRGNPHILNHHPMLAIVGTRQVSEYGKQVTQKLVEDLVPVNTCIVSGLARGIDGLAHNAALQNNLPTVAVLGCGIDIIYPSQHKVLAQQVIEQAGAIVSEYPLGFQPTKYTFPARNRIVAGLSQGVVVIEGSLKSGSLITARLAIEENRQVYAVPGNIFNAGAQGPLYLIQQGAIPIRSAQDIIEDLQWTQQKQMSISSKPQEISDPLSTNEQKVLSCIGYDPMSIDALESLTNFPSGALSEILTLLELDGHITLLPGAKVCRQA